MNSKSGIGLRQPHYQQVLEQKPDIAWFEVHSENFFYLDSPDSDRLNQIKKYYPLSMHGVGLSLGSADGLSKQHLAQLRNTVDYFKPQLVSEHLSWNTIDGKYTPDLLPLPYTTQSLKNFATNVKKTQDFLGRQILIENPSTYINFKSNTIAEWDFYAQLPHLTDCALLFDVNNIIVNAHNHNFNPDLYLKAINPNDVKEIHLAGATINTHNGKQIMIDDHGSKVKPAVWDLYDKTLKTIGNKPTLVEWDTNIPDLAILLTEAKKAQEKLQTT